jgi:hypothetical protein
VKYLTQVPTGGMLDRALGGRGDKGDVERETWKPDVDVANAMRVSMYPNSTQLKMADALTKAERKDKKRGRGE